ncbi:hypothetical protein NAC44_08565 [Allorhizobium sp. BGMRC 0089]|uniref:glycosyltransferase domain-containing protein n=1 Tax=Allorhizobium sonneratiae TaxID=2934936 RepID=UPI0020339C2C|nr:glycosyltransferase domain-containing protein [Allorhizobium sonneratiae]MCM2292381.1 hypothetical protein [Allorhizobium sonneratiae]
MKPSLAKAATETAPQAGPFPTAPFNMQFGTRPLVIHGHGHHPNKPAWDEFTAWYGRQPRASLPAPERVTLITCNNGHPAMGLFERSCDHLDLAVLRGGEGREPWDNARDKPQVILDLLDQVTTPYVLYADSRDAIIVGDPERLVDDLIAHFPADAFIFGGDRMNWPPIREFKRHEDTLAGASASDYRYLNGGLWIAHVETAKRIFHTSSTRPGHPEAPSSEQGILKQLLLEGDFNIHIDYACRMFQNLGFAKPGTLVFR